MILEAAYAECDADHPRRGEELRLRHPPAARAEARRDVGAVRLRPTHRRHRRQRPAGRRQARGAGRVDQHVAALASGELPDPDDAVLVGVHHAAATLPHPRRRHLRDRRGLPPRQLGTEYRPLADTEAYCRLVAGSVGRLSLGVFGSTSATTAPTLADDLGVALQLTNILRDIGEDRDDGSGVPAGRRRRAVRRQPDLCGPDRRDRRLVRALRDDRRRLLRAWPPAAAAARPAQPRLRGRDGRHLSRLLATIAADPAAVTRERVSLSTGQKLWVAASSLSGASA